jgi:hypothetical protein
MWLKASVKIFLTSTVLLAFPFAADAQIPRKVERFDGSLTIGKTYTADFVFDEHVGWRLSEPVKILPHHAARIEWIDKKGILSSLIKENRYQIEFKVLAKNVRRAGTSNRWNTTYKCAVREALVLIPSIEP